MRVLLINDGDTPKIESKGSWQSLIPAPIRNVVKPWVPLLPAAIQRSMIGGFGIGERRFPLGLGYLSTILKQGGHSVELVDRFADPGSWTDDVNRFDFVGVYSSTPFFDDCMTILQKLYDADFQGKIAFGGPHATAYPNTIPPQVDYVVQGEAEYIICDLVEGRYPSGTLIRTPRVDDLDALPRADFDLFLQHDRGYLNSFEFSDRTPIFNLNTSRSCPFSCSFCGVRDIWGRLWRAQSAERILQDILYLKEHYGCAGIYFREDLFTGDHARVKRLCELLIENEVDIVWACETRVETGADEELVKLMAESGCRGFYIGAESGSQKMLDYYNKNIQIDQTYKTCEHANKYGIAIYMSLIVAHPEETWADKLATTRLIRKAKPKTFGLAPFRSEFVRHGTVDYPEYDKRPEITAEASNSTWTGQRDRFDFLDIIQPSKVSPERDSKTVND